jgi:hypothetical protein
MSILADSLADVIRDTQCQALKLHIQAKSRALHFHPTAQAAQGCAYPRLCGGVEPVREALAVLLAGAVLLKEEAARVGVAGEGACLHPTSGRCARCEYAHALERTYAELAAVVGGAKQ